MGARRHGPEPQGYAPPPQRSRARKYVLYEGWQGEPRSHWQYMGCPIVPGAVRCDGGVYPPPFRWVVRASSARDACRYVRESVRANGAGQGILWDRKHDSAQAPPLGKDLTRYWALVSYCSSPTITLWYTRQDAEAEKALIDETGCGGRCRRAHQITRITKDEVKRRRPLWWNGPSRRGSDREREECCS